MGHQPNYIRRTFPALTEAGATVPFDCDMGFRNYPSRHTVSWEFGGDVKPSAVTAQLQGSNKHDARAATDEEWFDIGPAAVYANGGDDQPAPKLTFDDAVAKWIRIVVTDIDAGTNPTVTPTYAGLV
jgi:hypothetical protein